MAVDSKMSNFIDLRHIVKNSYALYYQISQRKINNYPKSEFEYEKYFVNTLTLMANKNFLLVINVLYEVINKRILKNYINS